jgi:RNA recognition motif-containing protein
MSERFLIRVMNLNEHTNEDKLEEILNQESLKSKHIWIAKYPNGSCAGYAFIDFKNEDDMLRAKELFTWADVIKAN